MHIIVFNRIEKVQPSTNQIAWNSHKGSSPKHAITFFLENVKYT